MEGKLALTFYLRPVNIGNKIKSKEGILFVQSIWSVWQYLDRKSFGQKVKGREQWLQLHEIRRTKMKKETSSNILLNHISNPTNNFNEHIFWSNMDDMKNDTKRPTTRTRSHHRSKRTGINVFMSYDILKKPNLVSLVARLNMSPTQRSAYTKALLTKLRGETSIITASYATADRSKTQVATKILSSCKKQ